MAEFMGKYSKTCKPLEMQIQPHVAEQETYTCQKTTEDSFKQSPKS